MDSVFFWFSKLAWLAITPDNLLVILTLICLVLLFKKVYKPAKTLLSLLTMCMVVITVFPLGEWLLHPLEKRFPQETLPGNIHGIIVLGGAEDAFRSAAWKDVELGEAAERNFAFLYLARKFPDAQLIYTGGSGSLTKQQHKGAHVAKKLFHMQGLDTTRIIFEENSRNTYENAKFSKHIATPKNNENWILITTSWHMPRSMGVFKKVGWKVIPYPVDHKTNPDHLYKCNFNFAGNLNTLKIAMKEWIGLMAYFATGKTSSLFPGI